MGKFSGKPFDINLLIGSSMSYLNNMLAAAEASGSKNGVIRVPQRNSAYQPGQRQAGKAGIVSADRHDAVSAARRNSNSPDIAEAAAFNVSSAGDGVSERQMPLTAKDNTGSVDLKQKSAGSAPSTAAPVRKDAASDTAGPDSFSLDFSEEGLMKGIILSEILGRPKCFRSGR